MVESNLLLLRGADIIRLFEDRERDIVETVRAAYTVKESGACSLPNCEYLRFPNNPADRIIPKPAYLGGNFQAAGIKWIASFPGNLSTGMERASATLILNSIETGLAEAIMESSVINSYRTAASAALAAGILHAGKPAVTAGIMGCGAINFEILRFLLCERPDIENILICDADPFRAEQFRVNCASFCGGRSLTITGEGADLFRRADIVSIATNASTPHLDGFEGRADDLTVLHVSLRDFAPEAILAADNVVDDIEHVCTNNTSLDLAARIGGNREFIRATLGSILLGKDQARAGGKPVVFSPFGLGILDIALACLARTLAREQRVGIQVEDFLPVPWTQRAYGEMKQ